MSDIITKSDSPMTGLLWTREEEELLKDWALIANSFRWLHERASIKFKKLNNIISLPVIIISTLTGTANFGLSTLVPSVDQTWAQIAIGGANILCGVLTTVQTYFKYAENTEAHQNAAKNWSRFHRVISIELALEPNKRKIPNKFLKFCIEEYNNLREHSPIIPKDIADQFKTIFKKKNIQLPDIYDNITNAITYSDYLTKNSLNRNILQSVTTKFTSIENKIPDLEKIHIDDESNDLNRINSYAVLQKNKPMSNVKQKLLEKFVTNPNTTNNLNNAVKPIPIHKPKETINESSENESIHNPIEPISSKIIDADANDFNYDPNTPHKPPILTHVNVKNLVKSLENNISINLNNKIKEIGVVAKANQTNQKETIIIDNKNLEDQKALKTI
jgi:hypothetical protein